MKRIACMILGIIVASAVWAEVNDAMGDSLITADTCVVEADTLTASETSQRKSSLKDKWWMLPYRTIKKGFNHLFVEIEDDYIENEPYKLQALLLNNNSYEIYQLTDDKGNSIRFSPEMSMKVGPYAGFSLFFFGWSVDIAHLQDSKKRSESTFRLYSLPGGIDIFYKKSGDNFRIRDFKLGDIDTSPMYNKKFDGINSTITGFNTYYIFNHHKFSYPAAFNQSTVQRKSAGSALAGIGYTHHTLEIDWAKLNDMVIENLGVDASEILKKKAQYEKVVYTDFSLSGGYGYNHVFHKDWLFAASLSLALAYKQSSGKVDMGSFMLKDFSFNNFNIDGVGRFGIVYNNLKWFAGASVIAHTYNYKKPNFYTNNSFGSLNLYVGFNFWKK